MRVIVTGATGFVGSHLCRRLLEHGDHVIACVRRREAMASLPAGVQSLLLPDLSAADVHALSDALPRADAVVHLAARDHFAGDGRHGDSVEAFRAINIEGTLRIAQVAANCGAHRFVFLSSIKAVVESSSLPVDEQSLCEPASGYGTSKRQAECQLLRLAQRTSLQPVILRPPLVYGPGVGKSFGQLLRVAGSGWPLPLGAISNARSLVFIDNLVDAICLSLTHPAAAGEILHVADAHALSTPQLIREIAQHQLKPARLLPVPTWLLGGLGRLAGRGDAVERLTSSLTVSIEKAKRILGWSPQVTVDDGLRRTVAWLKGKQSKATCTAERKVAGSESIRQPKAA